jgi:hypothetical protein
VARQETVSRLHPNSKYVVAAHALSAVLVLAFCIAVSDFPWSLPTGIDLDARPDLAPSTLFLLSL